MRARLGTAALGVGARRAARIGQPAAQHVPCARAREDHVGWAAARAEHELQPAAEHPRRSRPRGRVPLEGHARVRVVQPVVERADLAQVAPARVVPARPLPPELAAGRVVAEGAGLRAAAVRQHVRHARAAQHPVCRPAKRRRVRVVEQREQRRVDEARPRVADDKHPPSTQSLAGRGGVKKRAAGLEAGLEGPAGVNRSVGDAVVSPGAALREPVGAALQADGYPGEEDVRGQSELRASAFAQTASERAPCRRAAGGRNAADIPRLFSSQPTGTHQDPTLAQRMSRSPPFPRSPATSRPPSGFIYD